jgi:hypothetical protein
VRGDGEFEPVHEEEQWLDAQDELVGSESLELAPRPRRRLLGMASDLTLLGVLVMACGFIAGVVGASALLHAGPTVERPSRCQPGGVAAVCRCGELRMRPAACE